MFSDSSVHFCVWIYLYLSIYPSIYLNLRVSLSHSHAYYLSLPQSLSHTTINTKPLFFSIYLSNAQRHPCTRTHNIELSLTHISTSTYSHTQTHTLTIYLSLTHMHKHTQIYTHAHTHTLTIYLSLTHMHAHTQCLTFLNPSRRYSQLNHWKRIPDYGSSIWRLFREWYICCGKYIISYRCTYV